MKIREARQAFTPLPRLTGSMIVDEGGRDGELSDRVHGSEDQSGRSGTFDLPFLFRDFEHADGVFDGPIGQGFGERFRKKLGVRIVGYSSSGFQGLYNSKRPIHTNLTSNIE
jgi:hypothetical protein